MFDLLVEYGLLITDKMLEKCKPIINNKELLVKFISAGMHPTKVTEKCLASLQQTIGLEALLISTFEARKQFQNNLVKNNLSNTSFQLPTDIMYEISKYITLSG
jgi:hypothetical protein